MSTRVVIDPLTRIEGHLRVELLSEDQKIKDAYACTTQFRGVENVLVGRDPRDAWVFAQRICGVCTFTHGLCSIAAVEDAIGYPIPVQAKLIRDLMMRTILIQDHVIHFYQLQAFDWVNVVTALEADPAEAARIGSSLSNWSGNSQGAMAETQETVKKIVESGQLSIFTNGYWDHPGYQLPPAVDLLAVTHYLQALTFQREMIKLHTIFGGKNPHPNMLVGGMATPINMDNEWTINQVRLDQLKAIVAQTMTFVEQVYYPDVLAIMGFYKDWFDIGAANPNLMALGLAGTWGSGDPNLYRGNRLKPGLLLDGDFRKPVPFDLYEDRRVHQLRLVRLHGRERQGAAAVGGPDQPQLHRPAAALRVAQRPAEVHLGQGAALRRQGGAGRADRPHPARLRAGRGDRRPDARRGDGEARDHARADELDRGAHARAGDGIGAGGPRDAGCVRRLREPHPERRHGRVQPRQVGAGLMARGGARRRLRRGAARAAEPLGPDREGRDQELPVRRADHLERLGARPVRTDGRVRIRARPQRGASADRQGQAARGAAHGAFVRPVHVLRGALTGRMAMSEQEIAIDLTPKPLAGGRARVAPRPVRLRSGLEPAAPRAALELGPADHGAGRDRVRDPDHGVHGRDVAHRHRILLRLRAPRPLCLRLAARGGPSPADSRRPPDREPPRIHRRNFPFRSFRDVRNLFAEVGDYLMLRTDEGKKYIGHEPVARSAFFGIYIVMILAVLSGLSLYGLYEPRNWFFGWFEGPVHLFGATRVRLFHVAMMWLVIVFVPLHLYLVMRADGYARAGSLSAMLSGGRWVRKGARFEDE